MYSVARETQSASAVRISTQVKLEKSVPTVMLIRSSRNDTATSAIAWQSITATLAITPLGLRMHARQLSGKVVTVSIHFCQNAAFEKIFCSLSSAAG
jgi:hypothetical protein